MGFGASEPDNEPELRLIEEVVGWLAESIRLEILGRVFSSYISRNSILHIDDERMGAHRKSTYSMRVREVRPG